MNLLPCLTRISKRPEESVQETLAAAIPKIMAAFGNFANDNEIKVSFFNYSAPYYISKHSKLSALSSRCYRKQC